MNDAPTLSSEALCLFCLTQADQADALEFELWAQVGKANNVNTDPQTLLSNAQCYVCEGVTLFQALKLRLLAEISQAHNPSNQVDPQSLLSQAKCFACYSNASIGKLMELALLAQIAS